MSHSHTHTHRCFSFQLEFFRDSSDLQDQPWSKVVLNVFHPLSGRSPSSLPMCCTNMADQSESDHQGDQRFRWTFHPQTLTVVWWFIIDTLSSEHTWDPTGVREAFTVSGLRGENPRFYLTETQIVWLVSVMSKESHRLTRRNWQWIQMSVRSEESNHFSHRPWSTDRRHL